MSSLLTSLPFHSIPFHSLLTTSLYFLCFVLLTGMAAFVLFKDMRSPLHQAFALSALALLAWQATLFLFNRQTDPATLTLLGRLNFASAALVTFMAFRLVLALLNRKAAWHRWLVVETLALCALTVFTPLVDKAEVVQASQHVTRFGPLFWLYILHTLAYLAAALVTAFSWARRARNPLRRQLLTVALGILATAAVTLVTNVMLPFAFHVFTLQDVGTLSTLLFLLAVGYAIFAYHLFSVHVIVRATFVLAGLLALALELYSLALSFLVHLLPLGDAGERGFAATAIVLVVNAFTQQPVRHWLEGIIDRKGWSDRNSKSRNKPLQTAQETIPVRRRVSR